MRQKIIHSRDVQFNENPKGEEHSGVEVEIGNGYQVLVDLTNESETQLDVSTEAHAPEPKVPVRKSTREKRPLTFMEEKSATYWKHPPPLMKQHRVPKRRNGKSRWILK